MQAEARDWEEFTEAGFRRLLVQLTEAGYRFAGSTATMVLIGTCCGGTMWIFRFIVPLGWLPDRGRTSARTPLIF